MKRLFNSLGFHRPYSKISTLVMRERNAKISCCGNYQIIRLEHSINKTFDGPGLKDFIAKGQLDQSKNFKYKKSESVPYLKEEDLNGQGRKVFFEVQGCQMNVSDIEIVWSILQKNGYEKTNDSKNADIFLIMTCAVRESSEKKIWNNLMHLNAFKMKHKKKNVKIGILGCMAERLKEKLLDINEGIDLVAGPDSYKDLPRLLALTRADQKAINVLLSLDETYADVMPVRLDENKISAYVSIMRGCDNMCTYCIVPFTRGKERSRPIQSIVDEVKLLSEKGIREITLLGQNVNSYRDISSEKSNTEVTKLSAGFKTVYKTKKGGLRFDTLLDRVSQVDPNMRIRFTSPHPKDFPDEVLYLIRDRKNICCCIHLPAQSGSTAVLERMRRGYTREAYLDLVHHIRSILPNVFLTTDIITGFCGETEKDHQDTLDLLRLVKYNFVFHYPFSLREKTTAHRRYVDDVPFEVKSRRSDEVNQVFREICEELNAAQVNQTQLVLVEGFSKKSNEFLHGRNDGYRRVLIPNCNVPVGIDSNETRPIQPGDYVAVTITGSNSQTLTGEPLYHTTLVDFDEFQNVKCNSGVNMSV